MTIKLLSTVIGIVVAAFFLVTLATLFGAVIGWTVGLLFEQTILTTLRGFGVDTNFTMWQLGATLGFVSGFFKSTPINKD